MYFNYKLNVYSTRRKIFRHPFVRLLQPAFFQCFVFQASTDTNHCLQNFANHDFVKFPERTSMNLPPCFGLQWSLRLLRTTIDGAANVARGCLTHSYCVLVGGRMGQSLQSPKHLRFNLNNHVVTCVFSLFISGRC